ncbi:hypothetical protein L3081_07355 [Colwellia sp. MSW7]|uniref:Uncharacterized protein n=1 Tax=Colwellia maritima TaxID=2912588 RepID=A0ABS9WZ26_9GAMM|nr:hypothetical protein [Colwellia maritima]MCI2283248.1 hypothetical protein [Colwellia maritima]
MIIEQFINDKVVQMAAYVNAVIEETLHYTELDSFVLDTLSEWTLLKVTDETPSSAQERVFWHLIHEVSLHGAQALNNDLFFKSEINTCLDFFKGVGSYPIDCVGWRPIP